MFDGGGKGFVAEDLLKVVFSCSSRACADGANGRVGWFRKVDLDCRGGTWDSGVKIPRNGDGCEKNERGKDNQLLLVHAG